MLSVVIPFFNEQKNIPLVIEAIEQSIPKEMAVEVLLVNNGSTDGSQLVFSECLKNAHDYFKLVEIKQNQGYGHGILTGLKQAKGEVLAWTHADLQTDLKDLVTGYREYQKFNNLNLIIKGNRKNRRWSEVIFTFGMQVVVLLVLKKWIADINAQPKIFSQSFYRQHFSNEKEVPLDFSLDLFLLFKAKSYGYIKTIPVFFKQRQHGEAKGGGSFKTRIKLIRRTLSYILSLKKNIV